MTRRARMTSVLAVLLAGAIGLISSTQTWLTVTLVDSHDEPFGVAGSAVLPLLVPMSLTALALGAVLAMIGRYIAMGLGVIAAGIGVLMLTQVLPIVVAPSSASVEAAVSQATGIAGHDSVARLIESLAPSAWPIVSAAGWILLILAGAFVVITARTWRASGRRYSTETPTHHATGPLDAVDSWDELTRGDDPTDDGPSATAR